MHDHLRVNIQGQQTRYSVDLAHSGGCLSVKLSFTDSGIEALENVARTSTEARAQGTVVTEPENHSRNLCQNCDLTARSQDLSTSAASPSAHRHQELSNDPTAACSLAHSAGQPQSQGPSRDQAPASHGSASESCSRAPHLVLSLDRMPSALPATRCNTRYESAESATARSVSEAYTRPHAHKPDPPVSPLATSQRNAHPTVSTGYPPPREASPTPLRASSDTPRWQRSNTLSQQRLRETSPPAALSHAASREASPTSSSAPSALREASPTRSHGMSREVSPTPSHTSWHERVSTPSASCIPASQGDSPSSWARYIENSAVNDFLEMTGPSTTSQMIPRIRTPTSGADAPRAGEAGESFAERLSAVTAEKSGGGSDDDTEPDNDPIYDAYCLGYADGCVDTRGSDAQPARCKHEGPGSSTSGVAGSPPSFVPIPNMQVGCVLTPRNRKRIRRELPPSPIVRDAVKRYKEDNGLI